MRVLYKHAELITVIVSAKWTLSILLSKNDPPIDSMENALINR